MQTDGPLPGEELNRGRETIPRPAATVIVLRGGPEALEVLLVRRNPASRFLGGAWVFPGGALDHADGVGDPALRACALRELGEEAGIRLDRPDDLVVFSRWITPAQAKTRFDTWFYLALLPADEVPEIDGVEVVDARWYSPQAALEAARSGELFMVFPTIKHLEQLSPFRSAAELLEYARDREIHPVQPRVLLSGETARVLLPGEPGYDELSDAAPR